MTPPRPHDSPAPVPLAGVPPGRRARIAGFEAGRELLSRLCALGLTPGLEVEVLASGPGPVILNVKGSRLILGHGMAAKILVRLAGVRGLPPCGSDTPCTPPAHA